MTHESQNKLVLERTYTELDDKLYSLQKPRQVSEPRIYCYNDELAEELELEIDVKQLAAIFSGNLTVPDSQPFAQAYAGHQFGHFTILGDGRALVLGEKVVNGRRYDIQLKGSGQTPYSRNGDGLATLVSMVREFLVSEAMHRLKIPTTRSLCVIETGDPVRREAMQAGGILTRVAASHIRIGTFEFAAQSGFACLKQLLEYTVARHFPELIDSKTKAEDFFLAVMERQISLICHWLRVGFIHGVMNTDNVALSGETIDYGPCAFMNAYHPDTVYSSIDVNGRYAYANQPYILKWNLARLAEALLPLFHENKEEALKIAQPLLDSYDAKMSAAWTAMMRRKLGILFEGPDDVKLIQDCLKLLEAKSLDYTNSFYRLTTGQSFTDNQPAEEWHREWKNRISNQDKEATMQAMQEANPVVIPRNHRVEEAIRDKKKLNAMLEVLKKPYDYSLSSDYYQEPPESEAGYKTFCGT